MNLGHNNLLIQKKGKTEQVCGPPQGYGGYGKTGYAKTADTGDVMKALSGCWCVYWEQPGIVCFRKMHLDA